MLLATLLTSVGDSELYRWRCVNINPLAMVCLHFMIFAANFATITDIMDEMLVNIKEAKV